LGKQLFSHWVDIRPKKTQSENHCKYFKSVLRTLTKFVLFSNQKVRKIFSSLKLLGNSIHNKSRSKAIAYDFVEKVLTLLRNMCDQDDSSEKELIRRQLCLKGFLSNSWISFVRTILAQYSLPSLHESCMHIVSSKTKSLWKKTIYQHINSYWKTSINRQLSLYQSLIFLRSSKYTIGKCHHWLESVNSTMTDVQRLTVKLRLMTGVYHLQTNRSAFCQHEIDTCPLCKDSTDDRVHFIAECTVLASVRSKYYREIKKYININSDFLSSKWTIAMYMYWTSMNMLYRST
jgi:hypothetical protein